MNRLINYSISFYITALLSEVFGLYSYFITFFFLGFLQGVLVEFYKLTYADAKKEFTSLSSEIT